MDRSRESGGNPRAAASSVDRLTQPLRTDDDESSPVWDNERLLHQSFDGLRRDLPAEDGRAGAFRLQPRLQDLHASAARPLPDEVGSLPARPVGGYQARNLYPVGEYMIRLCTDLSHRDSLAKVEGLAHATNTVWGTWGFIEGSRSDTYARM